jgi:6-phosphogluconolactonase
MKVINSVLVFSDSNSLALGAAEHFVRVVNQATGLRGRACVALSGGSTPKKLFSILATEGWKSRVPWSKVHFFWVDERMVPYSSSDSNYGVAKKLLFDRIEIPSSNVHPIPLCSNFSLQGNQQKSMEKVLHDYSCEIKSLSGDEPVFDLILLGMGTDGHTASIFPKSGENSKELTGEHVFSVTAGKPFVTRVSLREEVITRAGVLIFLAEGIEKADMVKAVIHKTPSAEESFSSELPARRVTLNAKGDVYWLLDEGASEKIDIESKSATRG